MDHGHELKMEREPEADTWTKNSCMQHDQLMARVAAAHSVPALLIQLSREASALARQLHTGRERRLRDTAAHWPGEVGVGMAVYC